MTLTIADAYDLPRSEDIRAMGFVIKLKELAAGSAELTELLGLPSHEILRAMRDAPGVDIYALGLERTAG